MGNEDGRSPSGPGCSAEPGPISVVPAVPVSIPNAEDIMRFLRWQRQVFRDASATRVEWGIRQDIDHVVREMVLDELITEIDRGEHPVLQSESAGT